MEEQDKTESSCGSLGGGVPWFPLRKWWLFNQDLGLPPFLEPGEPRWTDVDRLQRSLAGCSWPGYIPAPLFVPYISGSMHQPGQKISEEQYKWRVSLDVAHFSSSEISLSVRDGFLEVGGKHEERPDEHGFIARCFTRKYRLPAEIDATKIVSTLSVDGILTVEAPVSKTSVPSAIVIPIKVDLEASAEKQEEEEAPDTDPDSCRAPEAQCFPSAEDDGEKSQQEVQGDQGDQPGSATAEPLQPDEMKEQEEESHEEPAAESAPVDGEGAEGLQDPPEQHEATSKQPEHEEPAAESAPVDGEGAEGLQDPPEQHEATSKQPEHEEPAAESAPVDGEGAEGLQDPPEQHEATSKQPEHEEPAVDGEIQVMTGSGESAEEITHPKEPELGESPPSEAPSQELEVADVKQEHTE